MNKIVKIALVGNPNSGKSTVFNALTGLNQKVANFPGVTVDKKTGRCKLTHSQGGAVLDAEVIDLPGTYSLYPKTPDERIPFQVLCDPEDESHPDIILLIADASSLKRSLFLCSQVIDLKIPCILALNMMDLVEKSGAKIDLKKLEIELGIPVVPCNALKGIGIKEIQNAMFQSVPPPAKDFIPVRELAPGLLRGIRAQVRANSDYAAFQIANNLEFISFFHIHQDKTEAIRKLIVEHHFDAHALQTKETLDRYKIISSIIQNCVNEKGIHSVSGFSGKIDQLLTHRIFGYLFFLLVLFLVFQAIFSWSSYPMEWIQDGFLLISSAVQNVLPQGVFSDLLVNGIFAGLSGIIVFIPQIASLFFFIALLEDSGYMARVSFMMDRLMRPFGLNGKSVIPLASGVACAIPAIMSTRTISNQKERLITILVTPFMSCSARIPVYTLLISLVIPNKFLFGFLNLQGLVLMGMYLLGFLAAIGAAFILKFIIQAKERSYFIMEMPVYRMPRWSNIGLTILEKVKIFLFDAGKIIIAISIVLWFLSSYGPPERIKEIEQKYVGKTSTEELEQLNSEKLENSYAGIVGKTIEPVIRPLGFDWKIGIALITSFAAREVFVGTMSTIYSIGDAGDDKSSLREKMLAEINPATGKLRFSTATGFSLMIFYAFALQCISTVAVVYRETKSRKIPLLQMLIMSSIAYLASLAVYQIFR